MSSPNSEKSDVVMVKVEDFSAEYDGTIILKDINFQVRRKEVLVIAGESGSGKSTLLRHIIGLEPPARGRILVEGKDLSTADPNERRRLLSKIGVTFQSGDLFGSMSLLENVTLPMAMFTKLPATIRNWIALTKLQLVGLADQAHKLPAELSGGMQKRAAIARALALDPQILFLDEPSAGLDPFNSAELDHLILSLRRLLNMTFVIVSHQLPSMFAIADRVVLLRGEKKTIVAEGDPKDLRDHSPDPWVRAFFNRQLPPDSHSPHDPSAIKPSEAQHEHVAVL